MKLRLTQPASWGWSWGLAELGNNEDNLKKYDGLKNKGPKVKMNSKWKTTSKMKTKLKLKTTPNEKTPQI